MKDRLKLSVWVLLFLVFLVISSAPFWSWYLKESATLDMLIIDKTVPDATYREHQGLVWFLNQSKIKKSDGTAYNASVDYIGYNPIKEEEQRVSDPESEYDFIYIADGYGVYEENMNQSSRERSELIYGGMTNEDVSMIRSRLSQHSSTLISEFNTFASPTPEEVKQEFYALHNLHWDGWIGRYFSNLQSDEIPKWMKDNYQNQYGKEWSLEGKGFVYVHESDKLIVLTENQLNEDGVVFSYTDEGKSHFNLKGESIYQYWFDIVQPVNEEEVMANFSIDVIEEAEELLAMEGISTIVPAVLYHQNPQYEAYYFAGDFADQGDLPSFYKTEFFPWWKKLASSFSTQNNTSFYWRAYIPMMKEIVEKKHIPVPTKVESKLEFKESEGYTLHSKTGEEYIQIFKDGEWQDILVKGVNMGIAKPGTFPGETAITKQEYARWFQQIGDMNANAIRIYTIHPPHFYEALAEYNVISDKPLYVFHGVWLNEEIFYEEQDAFSSRNTEEFKDEIKRIVDLVHGNATIEERPGHASGNFTSNVSPYVMGWVLGVEWDPEVVLSTNGKHKGIADFNGNYVYTTNAEPFEIWLAEMMEYTIDYEQRKYGWQRPMSFTNWVTTDLLEHPAEPSEKEDMVSVNPNVIYATEQFESGMFASYHIYPYYPDFLNFEERYVEYIDHRGEKNNYAGYLQHMKEEHRMPLLVAEFGIPASRGLTHNNVYGWNQGFHTEEEQGQILQRLFEDIVEEKWAGGLVFSWHDEWFKRTWNTMDYDNPDRRPNWSNVQTNEQRFGLLSFDPGESMKVQVDGEIEDWKKIEGSSSYPPSRMLEGMFVTSDEAYVYLRIDAKNIDNYNHYFLFNTIDNQGQTEIPEVPSLTTEGIDFIVELSGKESSRILVDSYYDTFYYSYGHSLNMIKQNDYASQKDNGVFHPIRLTLNKEITVQNESGQNLTFPFEFYETGKLLHGNSDSSANDYNSLADFYINKAQGVLEVRIPWALLNIKDPSTREAMGDIWSKDGLAASSFLEGIRMGVISVDKQTNKIIDTYPSINNNHLAVSEFFQYKWDPWDTPAYHERLKSSYYLIQQVFRQTEK
ncbi:hypothetical protein [Sutcliffiella deserti]|uniref:hypothetical protein n=1 Tax=Sutcliffiella deserti TaxID=2875501 RepID=UPI001CBB6A09|nr:hypothetical protein [Sutcliffiella deserti]